jgi:nitric oxide reductase subunit B
MVEQVKKEIKTNRYEKGNNKVTLTDAQFYAANELIKYYTEKFTNPSFPGAFAPAHYITSRDELRSLTAFFFWGAWVCGVERPGEKESYTHNWPFDPEAGNTPASAILFWSLVGSLGLIVGL